MSKKSQQAEGGLPGPIGETFGAFEPRFYGVTFLLTTPSMFQAWVKISGLFPDSPGPNLSPFDEACLQTAIEHEFRHFHDSLLSPFANMIWRLRMMAAFNGLKAMNRGLRVGANCLPIPLIRWVSKTEEQRAAWLAEVSSERGLGFSQPLRPLPLPLPGEISSAPKRVGLHTVDSDSAEAELQAFAEVTMGAYKRAASLMEGSTILFASESEPKPHPDEVSREFEAMVNPRNIFEASALAVQLQAAWTNLGEEAANVFGNFLFTSKVSYAKAFRLIASGSAPPDNPGLVDPNRISAIAVWCLLGDPSAREGCDPVVRLARLLLFLRRTGGISQIESIGKLWDHWDQFLELKSWRAAVIKMRDSTADTAAKYESAAGLPDEPQAQLFAELLANYRDDQIQVTDLLLYDPDEYVYTRQYVERLDALPVPLLNVQLGENFVAPVAEWANSDAIRVVSKIDEDSVRGWNRLVIDKQTPPRSRLLDLVLEIEFQCKICDIVFSDASMSPLDRATLVANIEESTGMTPLFVF
jgi:hypothetical protein